MTMITVLKVRGNAEPMDRNMLSNVTAQLDRNRFTVKEIAYSASLGPAGGAAMKPSEMLSVQEGCRLISEAVRLAPGPVVIIYYSLGGVVATEWLKQNPHETKVILAGGLANPRRKPGKQYGFPVPVAGEGIFGQSIDDRRQWAEIAYPGDVMTAMPPGSILRAGSDLIQWMSLVDPIRWADDVARKLPRIALDLAGGDLTRLIALGPNLAQAITLMDAYARGGAHTTRYFEPHWRDWQGKPISGVDLLARCIKGVKA